MTAFVTAPSIAWGPGAIEQLSGLGARRAFLLVDPAIASAEAPVRALEELERSGAAVERVVADAEPQRLDRVVALAERMRSFRPEWIVAVGGGACLDGAKAARLWLECPDLPVDRPPSIVPFPDAPSSRLTAVPTTNGGGAEASWTCDLFLTDGAPVELAHRALVPEWALVDPAFASAAPAELRRAGGLATGAIAVEAFLSAWSSPFSDALAVGALTTVTRDLPVALRWTDEPEARASLQYASTMAGVAASNAQRGLAHALARALIGPTGLAYGTLLALVLPPVLEFDRPGARERLELLASAVAPPGESGRIELAVRWRRFAENLGVPRGLARGASAVRSSREKVVAWTLASPAVAANPRVPSSADVDRLLESLLAARP